MISMHQNGEDVKYYFIMKSPVIRIK